jgi:hypothetical protein
VQVAGQRLLEVAATLHNARVNRTSTIQRLLKVAATLHNARVNTTTGHDPRVHL